MADSPCTCCERGFNGRAFIAYINFYDDRELVQKRLRLCVDCIADHFLLLVEKADSRNEHGIWIDSRETESWGNGAHSEITATVPDAVSLSRQRNATMRTSTEAEKKATTSSVTNAGYAQQSRQRQSSAQSKELESKNSITDNSSASSKRTSSSASRQTSSAPRSRQTKSTGS